MTLPRGTSNGNARGGSADRARRRAWLVETFRADADLLILFGAEVATLRGMGVPACRCYRCGKLLTEDRLTVDRIVPGIHGGTYRRNNIRPACGRCNSATGAVTRRKK
jgi:5-methylcytosine-specific restriction endonuclease McrA